MKGNKVVLLDHSASPGGVGFGFGVGVAHVVIWPDQCSERCDPSDSKI